jgi:glycosyltransferase involved in cell wall biosynthesis
MAADKSLLSICIPTFNRAEYLDKTIASVVSQKEFHTEPVELVISDNASNDDTESIVKKYQDHNRNIYYSRNDTNISGMNLPLVVNKAHGVFRKLHNDTLLLRGGTLSKMLNLVKDNLHERPVIFFSNRNYKNKNDSGYGFESFIRKTSYYITWMGAFGIWEDDINIINEKLNGTGPSFWHTRALLEILENKGNYLINNEMIFEGQKVNKKNMSYGIYNMFYKNYLGLFEKYLEKNIVLSNTFCFLKKDVLFGWFLPWIAELSVYRENYLLSNENYISLLKNSYKEENYYWLARLKLYYWFFRKHTEKFLLSKGLLSR